MPNQDNKVTLVNTLIEYNRNEMSSSTYDIIVLSQDLGVNDTGRVIAVQSQGGRAGYDHDLVSYAYVVRGSDASLTISGNYGLNDPSQTETEYRIEYWSDTGNEMGLYGSTHNDAPDYVWVSTLYNAYHFAYNNDDNEKNIAGALKFNGNNTLVLTAQAGSKTSNYYWHADGFDETKPLLKTDDAITIVSENYGIYSPWKSSGDKFVYGVYVGGPSAPGKTTASYAIHSTGEKLTVKSDLAGDIRSQVAASHTGYYLKNSDPTKEDIASDDSSGNIIEAAGVKVKNLVLESNFRAVIEANNHAPTEGELALEGKNTVYQWDVVTVQVSGGEGAAGKTEKKVVKSEDGALEIGETTVIAGFGTPTANNNKINSYGVLADGSITLEDGVWSGEIKAEASDISIIANYKNTATVEREGKAASATGNTVGAYGIKASSVKIAKMGSLQKDFDGVNETENYGSSISVDASNVSVVARSIGKPSDKGPSATSANTDISIVAAAIDATTIDIGEMTSEFVLDAKSTGRLYAGAFIDTNNSGNSGSVQASASVYGIRGKTVNFGIFNGSIIAEAGIFDYETSRNFTHVPSVSSVAIGIDAGTLTASRKFAGTINATHIGVYTTGNFTVTGVISTVIERCGMVGINTVDGSLTADAFAGSMMNCNVGISVKGDIRSITAGDAFDISGSIVVSETGIASLSALNLCISGTVSADTAIMAEHYYDKNTRYFAEGVKFNDRVELTATARVTGEIDLGQLTNVVVINSSATLNGVVYAEGGSVNTTFILDEKVRGDNLAAYRVSGYNSQDTLIKGSQLININMSYAVDGEYKLIEYGYHYFMDDTGVVQYNLWNYWQSNEFQLNYLDKSYNVNFTDHDGNTHSGSVTIQDGNGKEAIFTVIYKEGDDVLSVKVEGLSDDFAYVPKQLGVTGGASTYVSTAFNEEEGTFTLDWSELDSYLKANIESTLSGEATYGLEKVTNYSIRYKFVDKEGNDLVTIDENGNRIWNELKFYEVDGTALTIGNVPADGNGTPAADIVWEITPIDDTVTAVEGKAAKAKLKTESDAEENLVISWDELEAEDIGLVDFDSIDLVEIVYSLYDKNGKVIGGSQSKFITLEDFNKGSYTFAETAGNRIHWELKFHDIIEASNEAVDDSLNGNRIINWGSLTENAQLSDNQTITGYTLTYELANGRKETVEVNGTNFEIIGSKGNDGNVVDWSVEAHIDNNNGFLLDQNGSIIPADGTAAFDWTDVTSPADYYILTYSEYDADGNVIVENKQIYVDGSEKKFVAEKLNKYTASVEWNVEGHYFDVKDLGTSTESGDFSFNGGSGVKSYTQQYDAEKSQLTINWKELHESLNQDVDGDGNNGDKLREEFNFANGILHYELEYQLYDAEGKTIGNTIVVTLGKDAWQHTFNGVEEGTSLDWRIRIVGNETGGLVSKWSDWNKVNVDLLPTEGFDFENFTSDVRSVYSTVADEAVPNSIAELTWSGLNSAEAVRCYEIEYFRSVDQVMLEEAVEAGYESVAEYIVSDDFFSRPGVEVYTKVVSGKSVVLSNLKNNGHVYWRIRAIDETANLKDALSHESMKGVSEWVAGNSFCVHQNGETIAPDMNKNQVLGSYVDVAKPATFDGNADINGYLCWNSAVEQDSGMRDYVVEFRDQSGKVVATKTVQASDAKSRCIGEWVVGEGVLLDCEYSAEIAGETDKIEVNAKIVEYEAEVEQPDGSMKMETKYKTVLHFTTNIDLTGKTVTFSDGSQTWDVEVYNEDNNESGFVFQKFDYELSLDDVDAEFAPSKGYSVSIKATDNFSNTAAVSTIITNITVDDRGPVFQDKEDNGYFITDDRPADPETDTLLKGYICWNGAFDGETDVCRYVMQLVDDSGNLLVDRDGKDCMEVIDQTDDPTSVDPVSRSIVTYFAEDLTLDGEYTVLDSNGDKMEAVVREITETDEFTGNSTTKIVLMITAEGDLTGKTINVNGEDITVTEDICNFYKYSVNLDQWNLDDPRYTYKIYAEDSLGNRSPVIMQDKFSIDTEAPVFAEGNEMSECVRYDNLLTPDDVNIDSGAIRLSWKGGSNVKQYLVKFEAEDGTVISRTVSAQDITGGYSMALYRNDALVAGEEYTVIIAYTDENGDLQTEEITAVAREYFADDDTPLMNGVIGADSQDVKYLVWGMEKSFNGTEQITVKRNNEIIVTDVKGAESNIKDRYQYINYDKSFVFDNLDLGGNYSYTITEENNSGVKTEITSSGNLTQGAVRSTYTARLGWQNATDDYGIKQYIIRLDDGHGTVIERTVSAEAAADDYALAIYRNENLILGEEYRIIVTYTDENGDLQTEEITAVARENFAGADNQAMNGISGSDLNGVKYLTWSMDKTFAGNETITVLKGSEQIVSDVSGSVENTNDKFQYVNYSNSMEFENLTSGMYNYTVIAEDFFGVKTKPVTGSFVYDKTAPVFLEYTNKAVWEKIVVDGEDGEKINKIVPTFSWSAAEDVKGGVGVYNYVVEYRKGSSGEWTELCNILHEENKKSYEFKASEGLDVGIYEYRITAFDKLGNSVELTGNFGAGSIQPLMGSFAQDKKFVEVNTEKNELEEFVRSTVTLNWEFSGNASHYRVVIASDPNFSDAHIFWTTASETAAMQMVFDNATIGRPVDLFDSIGTLYWKVDAYDADYNMATESFGVATYKFTDEESFVSAVTPQPVGVEIIPAAQFNNVNTDEIGIKWRCPNDKAGVYYFTVQLMSEDGTTELYSGSTLSVSSDDRLTADIDPGVVKITSISNGKELSISDLRKFFGVSNIKDGKYKVIVTAFDAQGSATSSEAVGFIMDTTRPGMVQVKNAQALAINRGDFTSNELVVEWEAIEDLSGIDYYEVKYRMVGAEDWITRNIKETKFSVEVNSNGENTQFEYCITAIDQNGNRGIEWIENGIITSIPDHFFDTLANAKDISEFGWNHGEDFVINEETVGLGDVADTFKLVTTYGRTLEISASDFEVLFGTVGNVKVEIFTGNDLQSYASFTFAEGDTQNIELNAGTTYVFKVTNADDTNGSASRYNLTLKEVSQSTENYWFNTENFSTSVEDVDGDVTGNIVTDKALFSWSGMDSCHDIASYEIKYIVVGEQLSVENLADYINGLSEGVNTIQVTGPNETTVDFSTASGYVYWIIRAEDVEGNVSSWNAGSNFFVSAVADTKAPYFDVSMTTSVTGLTFTKPAAADMESATTISGKIVWDAAKDDESGIKEYVVEISVNGGAYTEFQRVPADRLEVDFSGFTAQKYLYRIKAIDFAGKESSYVYGPDIVADHGAPVFFEDSADVSVENDNTAIVPTITWNAAKDHDQDLGIRYYKVYVVENKGGTVNDWGTPVLVPAESDRTSYSVTLDELNLKPGDYLYKVEAYDYFDNVATLEGEFGSPDTVAPFGNFIGFSSSVKVNYETREIQTPGQDNGQGQNDGPLTDSGSGGGSSGGSSGGSETVVQTVLIDAEVVIDWTDNFTDAVHYKVAISNDPDFEEGSELYSFWTTAEEASATKMVFNAATTGRPVGIFANMDTVYYRVYAYDAAYNKATASSGLQSFEFKDEGFGQKIQESSLTAVPQNVVVSTDNMVDGCHTDRVALSWTTSGSQLGVYYYEVELLDADDETVIATASTLDDLSDKLVRDSIVDNSYYSMNIGESSTEVVISDLKKFFNMTDLSDGSYKVRVNAYSAAGNKTSSEIQDLVVDTKRPDPVKVINYNMIPSSAGEDLLNLLMVEWEKPENASEIAAYEVYWRINGDWECCRIENKDGNVTSISALPKDQWPEMNFTAIDQKCEFYVIAIDKQNNVSKWQGDNIELSMTEDLYPNFQTDAKELVNEGKVFANLDRMTVGDIVGIGDGKDYFKVTTDNAAALTLSADELLAAIPGFSHDIVITIYEGDSAKAWKSFSVKDTGKVFHDLLLKADTTYTFCVSSSKETNTAAKYNLILDKKELPTDNNNSLTTAAVFDNHNVNIGWIGFGDTSDYFKLVLDDSGKYSFKLDGVAAATDFAIYETGSSKAVVSISASEKNIDGVTTKEVQLDKNKDYYIIVSAGKGNNYGTDYNVTMNTLETYPEGNADDDSISINTPDISSVVSGEWVGVFDPVDNYKFALTEAEAGIYEFQLSGVNGKEIKAVIGYMKDGKFKTIGNKKGLSGADELILSLDITDDIINAANGELYLQISANGKNANSAYELEVRKIGPDVSDKEVSVSNPVADWVGLGNKIDYIDLNFGEDGYYDLNVSGAENPLKVQLFETADGKTKRVKSVSLTAVKSEGLINGVFLDTTKTYKLEVTATGAEKGNNSDYTVELSKRADDGNNNWANAIELDAVANGSASMSSEWLGLGDAEDYYHLDLGTSGTGVYELKLSGIDNKAKVTIYENGKAVKSINASAAKDGVLSNLLLDSSKAYYAVVKAGNAETGKDEYTLTLTQTSQSQLDGDSVMAPGTIGGSPAWVGFGDANDYYSFTASDVNNITLSLGEEMGDVKIIISTLDGTKVKTIKTMTVNSKNPTASTGDLCLIEGHSYNVEVIATRAKSGVNADYSLSVVQWDFSSYAGDDQDNSANGTLTQMNFNESGIATTVKDAVWSSGDKFDYYCVEVLEDGSYTLNTALTTLNGSAVKVSIGTVNKGGFKALQSITGKAGSDVLEMNRNLTAGTYYIKVESTGSNGAAEYSLEMVNNNKRSGFDNSDDSWQMVADRINNTPCGDATTLSDWVGLGDAVDVFELNFEQNGVVSFEWDDSAEFGKDALASGDISLALVNASGEKVALAFDKETGIYSTTTVLMADADYYLSVQNKKPSQNSIDYKIDISLA